MKLVWVLYSAFAVAIFLPLWWGMTVKLSGVLPERPASLIGFSAVAVFLGLPFIVFALRRRTR